MLLLEEQMAFIAEPSPPERSSKADRAELEALREEFEALRRSCEELKVNQRKLEQENGVLRLQLQDHHGIMAADWAQTLAFQERLREEAAVAEKGREEAERLRAELAVRNRQTAELREDAARWKLLVKKSSLRDVPFDKVDELLEVVMPAISRIQLELRRRARLSRAQLTDELEQQLCSVCRDAKKTVLFLPCNHVCVCEGCRERLRPYRCPICQEPVQSHVARVHF